MDYKFWRSLRKKENKTDEEILLLKLKNTIGTISEILVSNSKLHCTDERAVEEIKKCVDKIINDL